MTRTELFSLALIAVAAVVIAFLFLYQPSPTALFEPVMYGKLAKP